MKDQSLNCTVTVDQPPEEAFAAINNVRGWWSGNLEGDTDKLGGEFTYRYKNFHYSKQKITELVPGKRVVWLVVDSYLSFVKDKTEWNGTRVTFEISRKGKKTQIHFTHEGLLAGHECFDACSEAWGSYITESLRDLIVSGRGGPNAKERRSPQMGEIPLCRIR
jgi:hypothetical protein